MIGTLIGLGVGGAAGVGAGYYKWGKTAPACNTPAAPAAGGATQVQTSAFTIGMPADGVLVMPTVAAPAAPAGALLQYLAGDGSRLPLVGGMAAMLDNAVRVGADALDIKNRPIDRSVVNMAPVNASPYAPAGAAIATLAVKPVYPMTAKSGPVKGGVGLTSQLVSTQASGSGNTGTTLTPIVTPGGSTTSGQGGLAQSSAAVSFASFPSALNPVWVAAVRIFRATEGQLRTTASVSGRGNWLGMIDTGADVRAQFLNSNLRPTRPVNASFYQVYATDYGDGRTEFSVDDRVLPASLRTNKNSTRFIVPAVSKELFLEALVKILRAQMFYEAAATATVPVPELAISPSLPVVPAGAVVYPAVYDPSLGTAVVASPSSIANADLRVPGGGIQSNLAAFPQAIDDRWWDWVRPYTVTLSTFPSYQSFAWGQVYDPAADRALLMATFRPSVELPVYGPIRETRLPNGVTLFSSSNFPGMGAATIRVAPGQRGAALEAMVKLIRANLYKTAVAFRTK